MGSFLSDLRVSEQVSGGSSLPLLLSLLFFFALCILLLPFELAEVVLALEDTREKSLTQKECQGNRNSTLQLESRIGRKRNSTLKWLRKGSLEQKDVL